MLEGVVYRAYIRSTGYVLEDSDFKVVYQCAMREAKADIWDGFKSVLVELEKGYCSSFGYLNNYGFFERDFICTEYIGTISMTASGYSVYSSCGCCYVSRFAHGSLYK